MNTRTKALALAATLAAFAAPATAETVLKLGSVSPSGSPWTKWVQNVSAQVAEASNGELRIELFLDGQVGDEQTIIRQTVKGRLDLAYVSNVPLALLAEELVLPSVANLFDSVDQGTCVAHNHLAAAFSEVMEDSGVVPLTWMEIGHNALFSKTPIRLPSDLEGLKVRIAPTTADAALTKALGTSGIPLGIPDAIPGLQTGTVDAASFPALVGMSMGIHKIAPHVTVTNHSRLIGAVAISKRTWDKLSDQEKEWLRTFKADGPKLTEVILATEEAMLQKIADAGVQVHYLSDEEQAVWADLTKPILQDVIDQTGGQAQAIVERLIEAKALCGAGN